jgi:circadian clock protein KaiC
MIKHTGNEHGTTAGPARSSPPQLGTGIEGLDDVLAGGLPAGRMYLVQGDPGMGKTTLAMQFLLEGAARGEKVLYITLSETREELDIVARSHGWDLGGVEIQDMSALEGGLELEGRQTVYHHAEVELAELSAKLLDRIRAADPSRVVFDSLSELRLLAGDMFRFRRQVLGLKQFLAKRGCTVLILDDRTTGLGDQHLQSLAHGVLTLDRSHADFGPPRRRIMVHKLRGLRFREGYHDFTIATGGLVVYPRLVAAEHRQVRGEEVITSGLAGLDELTGGGLFRGSSVVLIGPAGVGKSTIAVQYVLSAAAQGRKSAVYLFDERVVNAPASSTARRLAPAVDRGLVRLRQVDPAELSAGEFLHGVRDAVEKGGAEIVVIDALNGFLVGMPGEKHLVLHLHELLTYLGQKGVTTFMLVAQHGMIGHTQTPVDVSFLADAVILFRFFEFKGAVRQAISVVKKRGGRHERTIRALRFENDSIAVGEPLHEFRGVLTGVPVYEGKDKAGGAA